MSIYHPWTKRESPTLIIQPKWKTKTMVFHSRHQPPNDSQVLTMTFTNDFAEVTYWDKRLTSQSEVKKPFG